MDTLTAVCEENDALRSLNVTLEANVNQLRGHITSLEAELKKAKDVGEGSLEVGVELFEMTEDRDRWRKVAMKFVDRIDDDY